MNENGSPIRQLLRRLYLGIRPSNRLVVLDYPVEAKPLYTAAHPHQKLFGIISQNDAQYAALLHASARYHAQLHAIKEHKAESDALQPAWNNGYVPGLDILMLYTLLNEYKPKKYVEIGSGTTTKTAARARRENGLSFSITCIDPFPRQEIRQVADEWKELPVQEVPVDFFTSLSENDVVFFDGTHTLLPNSDVSWFFLEILPVLPRGVLVQVHDIYLPYDYPQFMCDRYYSENYILGAVLLSNPEKYEVIAPNFYLSERPALSSILSGFWQHPSVQGVERHGGSFWFRVR